MAKSRILSEMHELAQGLHKNGCITDERMLEFDTLCFQDEVPKYTPDLIAELRHKWNLTQEMFAKIFNMSISAVQKWETGVKKPSGAARKLLHILETKGVQGLL